MSTKLTTVEKALRLNLQPSIYGVFAEIGAGQEVVNHFYRAGSASGTVAKSISAYDMSVSDTIYGKSQAYVSKERLRSMLDIEYNGLLVTLSRRAPLAHFFSFANTVETSGFNKEKKGRGWMGVKFQTAPNNRPHSCSIHVILHATDVSVQREILGVLGVNLIFAVYEYQNDPEMFIKSLIDGIPEGAVEINFIECSQGMLEHSNRDLSFLLVKHGLTKMILIGKEGEILQPTSVLRKKDVVLVRGRFRPPTKVTTEMFDRSLSLLRQDIAHSAARTIQVAEITFNCFKDETKLTLEDYSSRTDMLNALGYHVVVTNFKFHTDLVAHMNTSCCPNRLNLVLGTDNLLKVLNGREAYEEGGALSFIKILAETGGRVLLFPHKDFEDKMVGIDELRVENDKKPLIEFMKSNELIVQLRDVDPNVLSIRSDNVIRLFRNGSIKWTEMVPSIVVDLMQAKKPVSIQQGS